LFSEKADKNYILGQSCFGTEAYAHIVDLRLKYTKLVTYKFVKPICVLNMLTFIFLRANTGFWTVALTNISS